MRPSICLLLLFLTACDPDAWLQEATDDASVAACESALGDAQALTLGQAVLGVFQPLTEDSEVSVVHGSQGGSHSDLVVRIDGAGADLERADGLSVNATVRLGDSVSSMGQESDLRPLCRNPGRAGWYATVRVFWTLGETGSANITARVPELGLEASIDGVDLVDAPQVDAPGTQGG